MFFWHKKDIKSNDDIKSNIIKCLDKMLNVIHKNNLNGRNEIEKIRANFIKSSLTIEEMKSIEKMLDEIDIDFINNEMIKFCIKEINEIMFMFRRRAKNSVNNKDTVNNQVIDTEEIINIIRETEFKLQTALMKKDRALKNGDESLWIIACEEEKTSKAIITMYKEQLNKMAKAKTNIDIADSAKQTGKYNKIVNSNKVDIVALQKTIDESRLQTEMVEEDSNLINEIIGTDNGYDNASSDFAKAREKYLLDESRFNNSDNDMVNKILKEEESSKQ